MMIKRILNLHLFDEDGAQGAQGEQAGNGGQGSSGGNGSQGNAGTTYTYQQAEEIATARAQRAEQAVLKSFFQQQGMSESEVTAALQKFKEDREKNKPNLSAIELERDTWKAKAQQMENEKILSSKGVRAEDMDYVMFKIGKLVDDKTDFTKAAEKFLKENPKYTGAGTYRVSASTSTGDKGASDNINSSINAAIRAAIRR